MHSIGLKFAAKRKRKEEEHEAWERNPEVKLLQMDTMQTHMEDDR